MACGCTEFAEFKLKFNNMLNIGITGQNGFVGMHLYNTLGLYPEQYCRIEFDKAFFQSNSALDEFVSQCDVIIHLAAMNRHESPEVIYRTNIELVNHLIAALQRTKSKAHVLFSSSSQEERDNLYGRSKKEGREYLLQWAASSGARFTGLIIPNVFGPFGLPEYNSFIATFCYRLTHDEEPKIETDGMVKLIYVSELIDVILNKIKANQSEPAFRILHTTEIKVSEVLHKLRGFKAQYFDNGEIPSLADDFERNLFNTFRSYIDHGTHFPVNFVQHLDDRGSFVEVIRLGIGGQVSFSTTLQGITRGNHYHTRKIERFAVIKGRALIQLRKIGTSEVLNFEMDGNNPAYVDMPVWYTHNIKNVGDEMLYTNFWINEPYDPLDTDTYFEKV